MKKVVLLSTLLASLACHSSFALEDKIYCPETVICKGTAESCYVSLPKNNDSSFIFDNTHHHPIGNPNGVYTFVQANYDRNIGNGEGFCQFSYKYGSTDPHAAKEIIYENNIRMINDNSWHDRCWGSNWENPNPQGCPFIPKA